MKLTTVVLLIAGATAAHAQDDPARNRVRAEQRLSEVLSRLRQSLRKYELQDDAARIRQRVDQELGAAIARTRQSLRDLVLKELADAGIGAASLAAQVERFAKNLIDDELHNRLKKLLLSPEGKDLVQGFMDSQNVDTLDALIEAYFDKDKKGRYTIREEFEEVLAQMLDGVAPPASGSIGIDLVVDKANPDAKGLKVAGVTAGGPAAAAGIKAGDVLISVGGRDLTSSNVEEVMKSLKPGSEVKIVYERDKARTTVTVKAK